MTDRMKWTALAIICLALAGVAHYFGADQVAAALLMLGSGLGGKEWLRGSAHGDSLRQGDGPDPRDLPGFRR